MSKQRNITSEQILYVLIRAREEEIIKKSQQANFKQESVQRDKCKQLGYFSYIKKETGELEASRLFLISEVHDGYEYNLIYNDSGDVIAYNDFSEEKGLQVAKEFELDKERLERQIMLSQGIDLEEDPSANDSEKAGEGRDLASKEHEKKPEKEEEKEEEKKKNKEEEENDEDKDQKPKKLKNLKYEIALNMRTQIRLDTIVNGYYLWDILGIEDSLKDRMPEGVSEKGFEKGFLTIIDSKELSQLEESNGEKVKERTSEDTFAIVSPSGDIIELDGGVIIPQELGDRNTRLKQEQTRERWADGEHVSKPDTDSVLLRTSKFKIPNVRARFNVGEEWYLGVDRNENLVNNGGTTDPRQAKQISIIQEPIEPDKRYSEDSIQGRTRPAIEFKLEDVTEEPLNSKEQKQMNQLSKKEYDETKNMRKEHNDELQGIVEKLIKKYGEYYRKEIEEKVDKEHRKGNDVEQIEKNVKSDMDDIETDEFLHGRVRI